MRGYGESKNVEPQIPQSDHRIETPYNLQLPVNLGVDDLSRHEYRTYTNVVTKICIHNS